MSREDFDRLKGGIIKRKTKRKLGLFIDGVGLDRATRRIDRKIDLSKLVSSLSSGLEPEIARYYTLIPYEDDARQFAFLDAVERAGLEVIVKRLPPKTVKRQVSMDVHMASDLVGFAMGIFENVAKTDCPNEQPTIVEEHEKIHTYNMDPTRDPLIKRVCAIICPSRELSYAIYMSNQLGAETSLVDFGLYGQSDGWRGISKWIDLSTSETIWR